MAKTAKKVVKSTKSAGGDDVFRPDSNRGKLFAALRRGARRPIPVAKLRTMIYGKKVGASPASAQKLSVAVRQLEGLMQRKKVPFKIERSVNGKERAIAMVPKR